MIRYTQISLALLLLFIALPLFTNNSSAMTYTLGLIANDSTPIPEGTGNFQSVFSARRLGGKKVAFVGSSSTPSSQIGLYLFDNGVITKLVDNSTTIPGTMVNFGSIFDVISIGNGGLTFVNPSGSEQGIYSIIDGVIEKKVGLDTLIPGSTETFTGISINRNTSSGNGEVLFLGFAAMGFSGLYNQFENSLTTIVDENTNIPDSTGTFGNFFSTSLASLGFGEVAFKGAGSRISQEGIYAFFDETLIKVVDKNTAIPGGSGNFTSFTDPVSLDRLDNIVGFIGFGPSSQRGIYTLKDGTLNLEVDKNTAIPSGTGNFTNFSTLSLTAIGNGDFAFIGEGSNGQSGIYTSVGGVLTRILDENTAVPGGIGNFSSFFDLNSLGEGDLVFVGRDSVPNRGLYAIIDGELIVISDINTPIPGGTGGFNNYFDMVALGDGDLAFTGQDFAINNYLYIAELNKLTVDIEGEGNGTVTSTPVGIDCPDNCMELFDGGTVVTLTAVPAALSEFAGWTGDPDCEDGVVTMNGKVECTANFGLKLILNPIFPGIKNNVNTMSAENATPEGRVAFVWGFQPGSFTVGGSKCPGIELGISPLQVLGIVNADGSGVANFLFFVPSLGDVAQVFTQAIDIPTCRTSDVEVNIVSSN